MHADAIDTIKQLEARLVVLEERWTPWQAIALYAFVCAIFGGLIRTLARL